MGSVGAGPESGPLTVELLFKGFRIVLMTLPDLLELQGLLLPLALRRLLHADPPEEGGGPVAPHGCLEQRLSTEFAVGGELNGRQMQHFRAVVKSVLRRGLGRQVVCKFVGESQQILEGVIVFITRHPPERRVTLFPAAHLRSDLNL